MLRSDFGSALVSGAQKSGVIELVGFQSHPWIWVFMVEHSFGGFVNFLSFAQLSLIGEMPLSF